MTADHKADLQEYLRSAREVMLWKLDGLSAYDIRRPLLPTGTNLVGLVQHVATTETLYFGIAFDRPFPDPPRWLHDGEPNGSMWVRPGETRESVIAFCRRVWAHTDETLTELSLSDIGVVPWWPEGGRELSLHRAMVHVLADLSRHAGHADALREQIDGATGMDPRWPNLPDVDATWWSDYCRRLEALARDANS